MKKILILVSLSGILFSSCKMSQLGYSTDDAYVSPAEEKKKAELARAEEARKEAAERQQREEALAAQKAKDDANPYYKDPSYNADDYYDYEYSARLNRFHNPIGVGYYDTYYTNMYTYNQVPSLYGTSIYNNYGYNNYGYGSGWSSMPSTQFNNWSVGVSTGWGYGYNGYNSMSYYSGYSPYSCWTCYGSYGSYYSYPYSGYSNYGWGYDPYSAGYMNGYNNGYYNGYYGGSYYNMFDPNSAYQQTTYGPRNSGAGGTGAHNRLSDAQSADGSRRAYVESVQQQQANSPRFSPAYQSSARSYPQNNISSDQGVYRNRIEQNRSENGQGANQNATGREKTRNTNSERQYQDQNNNAGRQQNRGTGTWENNPGSNNSGSSGGSSSPRNGGGDSGARRRSR